MSHSVGTISTNIPRNLVFIIKSNSVINENQDLYKQDVYTMTSGNPMSNEMSDWECLRFKVIE